MDGCCFQSCSLLIPLCSPNLIQHTPTRLLKRMRDEESSRFSGHHPLLHERYLLMGLLGKGGFSEVHKVRQGGCCGRVRCACSACVCRALAVVDGWQMACATIRLSETESAPPLIANTKHACPTARHNHHHQTHHPQAFDLSSLQTVAVKVHQLNSAWAEAKKASYVRHAVREYSIHKALR